MYANKLQHQKMKNMTHEYVLILQWRARPGFEPGTTRTLCESPSIGPTSLDCNRIFVRDYIESRFI